MLWTLILNENDELKAIDCTGPHGLTTAFNLFASQHSEIIAIIPGCHAKYILLPTERDYEKAHLSTRKSN